MSYELGVDLGTTYTAAAVHRGGAAQIVELGNRSATIPSVVFLTEDSQVLTGEAANRRAVTQPDRVAREFKRRIGDPTPILVGGTPYSAEALSAQLLRVVIQQVSDAEGAAPTRVAVTHPANWGPYKLDLLHQAFRLADLEDVVTLTEPEAAAIHYSTLERIDPGMVVAVFDLGGGTFDAAILRKNEIGFDFLGQPEGIERLGGIDFDEAVFAFVARSLGGAFEELDPTDAAVTAAVSRLRRDCVEAKEALSSDTEVSIPVVLPTVQTDVRLTRSEFEQLIRPSLTDTIGAMQRAIRGADLQMDEVDLVLLVGGSSRIPLVGQMVGGELGRPVAIDAHPKHSIALGAARAAAEPGSAHLESVADAAPAAGAAGAVAAATSAEPPSEPEPTPPPAEEPPAAEPTAAAPDPEPAPTPPPPPSPPASEPAAASSSEPTPLELREDGDGPNKMLIGIGAAVLLIIIVVGAIALSGGGGGDDPEGDLAAGADTETTVADAEAPDDTAGPTTTAEGAVATTEAAPETTTTTTTTTEPAPTTTVFMCQGLCTHIESASIDENGELTIAWTAHGFEPATNNFHAHFYYNIYTAGQVGSNFSQNGESSQGSWVLTDQTPFQTAGTNVAVSRAPEGATAICVTVADSGHGTVSLDNAECVDFAGTMMGQVGG